MDRELTACGGAPRRRGTTTPASALALALILATGVGAGPASAAADSGWPFWHQDAVPTASSPPGTAVMPVAGEPPVPEIGMFRECHRPAYRISP